MVQAVQFFAGGLGAALDGLADLSFLLVFLGLSSSLSASSDSGFLWEAADCLLWCEIEKGSVLSLRA